MPHCNFHLFLIFINESINKLHFFQILWILNNDDHCCTLLRTLGRCGSIAISDLWLPQILNIFVEKNETIIKDIILKVFI